jgi:hypothetical protein
VLVGLSYEESEEYLKHAKRGLDDDGYLEKNEMSTDRYLELHDKHELARRQVLLAENEMHNLNPIKN